MPPLPASDEISAPLSHPGFRFIRSVGSIAEYLLEANGLTVLLLPESVGSTATFMVTYRVGSRHEVTGTIGATHLLEHLMFKGSLNYHDAKGNSVKQYLEQIGARYNATTSSDRTNYFATLVAGHLDGYMAIEADRMRNLLLREEDRVRELVVVTDEFERAENSPGYVLAREMTAAAFVAHPYHHATLGWRSDIQHMTIQSLGDYYRRFYWPDNATVSVIGAFEPEAALASIQKHFGSFTRTLEPSPPLHTQEPPQLGPRRVIVKRAAQLGMVGLAHRIPPASHPDYPALNLASAILVHGKNSRLYRALIDRNLTVGIEAHPKFNGDPSLHLLMAPLAPGATHAEVERVLWDEIEKIKVSGVTATEVQTAIAKSAASFARQCDGSGSMAGWLNECIAVGDWTLFYTLEDAVSRITPADIQRVVARYFIEDQSVTGWFVPELAKPFLLAREQGDPAAVRGDRQVGIARHGRRSDGSTPCFAQRVVRDRIAGIDLLALKTAACDLVTFRGSLPAGEAWSVPYGLSSAGVAGLLLDKGTTRHDKYSVAQALEQCGAALSFTVGSRMLEIAGSCRRCDLPAVLQLLAEQLRLPAFSLDELAKVKKQVAGDLRRKLDNAEFRVNGDFSRAIYPAGHPNRLPNLGEILDSLGSVTQENLRQFHAQHYRPERMTLVAVGDVEIEQLRTEVAVAFEGWTGGGALAKAPSIPRAMPGALREQKIFMPDKSSVAVVMGQPTGLRYAEPGSFALRVATAILGAGFTGRLMANIRDKEGLTYGISASLANDVFDDGDWRVTTTFTPELLDRGIAAVRQQIAMWHDLGVTAEELNRRKESMIGTFQVGLATTEGLASALLHAVHAELGVSWLDDYPAMIRALDIDQINASIRRYIDPASLLLITAGSVE